MEIAEAHGKTVAQVMLRWDIQHGVVTIPKSIREKRIVENADVFDFSLTDEEMKRIDGMNKDERTGSNPDTFNRKSSRRLLDQPSRAFFAIRRM